MSTCLSAIITVERSLTIIFPFVFKSKGMQKRSKIVTLVIIVLQPLVQFITLYYNRSYNGDRCDFPISQFKVYMVFSACVVFLIPFSVILIFNLATLATLIRHRFRRRAALIERRDHISVFTKLTLEWVGFYFVFYINIGDSDGH